MKVIRVTKEWEKAGVYFVRARAMCEGFGVPLELEFSEDGDGNEYEYILALEGDFPVATCRLHYLDPENAKVERVVTLEKYRGQRYGSACIEAAEERLGERGIKTVWINSRTQVLPFYEQLGYSVHYDQVTGSGEFECTMTSKLLRPEARQDEILL